MFYNPLSDLLISLFLKDDLGEDFSIMDWPVSPQCKPLLDQLIDTDMHNINPLPAYNISHAPMPPHKYKEALPGATVLASLAFTHFHVKANKRHIFNTVCCELVVLRTADELPSSPYKKRRFGTKPLFDYDDDNGSLTATSSYSQCTCFST